MIGADIVDILVNGTMYGVVGALLAMGFSLVYGVGGILNQSHGAFYALCAYLVYSILPRDNYSFYLYAVLIALLIAAIIGALAYQGLIKAVQDHEVSIVIITFALAYFFEQLFLILFGSSSLSLPQIDSIVPGIPTSVPFLGIFLPMQNILAFFVGIIAIVATLIGVNKSKLGQSIRAVSQDREAAQMMGINANRMLMYTIVLSVLLSGIAVAIQVPNEFIVPDMGWQVLTFSFAIVVLGGLGSMGGSIAGAFILSYIQKIVVVLFGFQWEGLVPGIVIIVILVIRPRGLFGKKERT